MNQPPPAPTPWYDHPRHRAQILAALLGFLTMGLSLLLTVSMFQSIPLTIPIGILIGLAYALMDLLGGRVRSAWMVGSLPFVGLFLVGIFTHYIAPSPFPPLFVIPPVLAAVAIQLVLPKRWLVAILEAYGLQQHEADQSTTK